MLPIMLRRVLSILVASVAFTANGSPPLAGTARAAEIGGSALPPPAAVTPDASAALERDTTPRTGDLHDLASNDWPVRVLVPYSRTFFWVDAGGPQGYIPAMLGGLEQHLNRALVDSGGGAERPERAPRRVRVVYVVTPVDEMQDALAEGRGEIAAGAIVASSNWDRVSTMSSPIMTDFDLCVVAGPGSRPLDKLEDLSGRPIAVIRGRAAEEMLQALEPQFATRGLAPPQLVHADDRLAIEDVLELVGAGARGKYEYTVLPRPLAEAWARSIKGLVPTPVSISVGQHAGYAVRKGMPQLSAALNDFLRDTRATERAQALMQTGVPPSSAPLQVVVNGSVDARLKQLEPLFMEYAAKYNLDLVRLAAQCFQESRFDPAARSHAGAMGLMQIMPATAKELGVTDPFDPRQSIEGGCKYMDWLHRTYFSSPKIARADQLDFCLAAYNAGAGNVRKWRALATKRGLDANKWFGNVERIARANGVKETVDYVSRITKYAVQFEPKLQALAAER